MNEARILIAHHQYHRALALLSLIEPRHSWPTGYQKIMAEALLHNGESSKALAILLDRRNLNPEQPHP
jgi:predicted negative regulator of RcsB-dependent stress response